MSSIQNLFDQDFEWELRDNPEFASQAGAHDLIQTFDVKLQDLSPEAYDGRKLHSQDMIEAATALRQTEALSNEDIVFLDLFESIHKEIVMSIDIVKMYLMPLNSIGAGCPTYSFIESIEWMRFESKEDYLVYLDRLNAFPRQMQDFIKSCREGLNQKLVASVAMVRNISSQLRDIINGDLPEMKEPLTRDGVDSLLEGTTLRTDIELAIEGTKSGFTSFLDFFEAEYLPSALETAGCGALPNGAEIYAQCLKFHTTTNLTPDEVHAIGLEEVAKIEARYKNEVLIPLKVFPFLS